jgi:hypothetical protein
MVQVQAMMQGMEFDSGGASPGSASAVRDAMLEETNSDSDDRSISASTLVAGVSILRREAAS